MTHLSPTENICWLCNVKYVKRDQMLSRLSHVQSKKGIFILLNLAVVFKSKMYTTE